MRSRQSAAAVAVLFALAIAGCSKDNDTPAPAPMQPPSQRRSDSRRHLRIDERQSTRDVQSRHACSALCRGNERMARWRATLRHRHPSGWHACGELYALGSADASTRSNTTSGPRPRRRSSPPTPPMRRTRSRRSTARISAWTSTRSRSAACDQRHRPEPAHQRRHWRHDH